MVISYLLKGKIKLVFFVRGIKILGDIKFLFVFFYLVSVLYLIILLVFKLIIGCICRDKWFFLMVFWNCCFILDMFWCCLCSLVLYISIIFLFWYFVICSVIFVCCMRVLVLLLWLGKFVILILMFKLDFVFCRVV